MTMLAIVKTDHETHDDRARRIDAVVPRGLDHPTAGKVRMAGIPVKFSVTPATVRLPPPLLGEHNETSLKSWLGLSADSIGELKKEKVI
jgi:crotonobetainyl-CoA:carnitine CoA-transferase CaiB-like acyl-CoA transferase